MLSEVAWVLADERTLGAAQLSLGMHASDVSVQQKLGRVRLVTNRTHVVPVQVLRCNVILEDERSIFKRTRAEG